MQFLLTLLVITVIAASVITVVYILFHSSNSELLFGGVVVIAFLVAGGLIYLTESSEMNTSGYKYAQKVFKEYPECNLPEYANDGKISRNEYRDIVLCDSYGESSKVKKVIWEN